MRGKRLFAALAALALLLCAPAFAEVPEWVEVPLGENGAAVNAGDEIEYYIAASCTLSASVGDRLRLYVEGGEALSWASSAGSVAKVEFDGESALVTVRAEGTAKLTAKLSGGKRLAIRLTAVDPYKPTGIAFDDSSLTLCVGETCDLLDEVTLIPEDAQTRLSWKSSRNGVAKVNSLGMVTARKKGAAKITVTTDNKKKAAVTVNVVANRVDGLSDPPADADIAAVRGGWTLWPDSVELTGKGAIECQLILINATGSKSRSIEGLELSLAVGSPDNIIAGRAFSKTKVTCKTGQSKRFKLTFPASSVTSDDLTLPDFEDSLYFIVSETRAPRLRAGKEYFDYIPTAFRDDQTAEPQYRALLIGQEGFEPKCTRNRNDVALMETMLKTVSGPAGGAYSITKAFDMSAAGVLNLIDATFGGATENDVSLFYIATRGEVEYADARAGRLSMVGSDPLNLSALAEALGRVNGRVIVILESRGSGAAVYAGDALQNAAEAAAGFGQAAADAFSALDRPVWTSDVRGNSGEFRVPEKFYVLACSRYQENSYGSEPGGNYFTRWLTDGVISANPMPADVNPADGVVTLGELFSYISSVGDSHAMYTSATSGASYQHVQVYPSNSDYGLFKR